MIPGTITYDCTRTLRPQADFVTADTDLVVFTMGGNDAGFSTIVQGCFVTLTRTAAACRSAVDTARARIPAIKQGLLADVAALRARGLREDAKIVQLGYPWLQVDNGFSLPDPAAPLTPYPAGDAVRSLITDATAELATVPAAANVGHPGQMTFVGGVTTKFSGHEPDAQLDQPADLDPRGVQRPRHQHLVPPQRPRAGRLLRAPARRRHLRRGDGHSPDDDPDDSGCAEGDAAGPSDRASVRAVRAGHPPRPGPPLGRHGTRRDDSSYDARTTPRS